MADALNFTFARPGALWLLLALPIFALVGWLYGVRRQGMSRLAPALRLAIITLLVITLAEPMLTSGAGAVSTVFVVDRSKSLTEGATGEVNRWVNDALADAGSSDRASVVNFGSSPVLAAPPASAQHIDPAWESVPEGFDQEYTNLESALALARALPLGGSRRIVVISDGAENIGNALNQAGQAASDGTPIDVVPVDGVGEGDLRVEDATAPNAVWYGETVNVVAGVATGSGGDGAIELVLDGAIKQTIPTTFPSGLSSYSFQVGDLSPGFHALEIRVSSTTATDRFDENNRLPLALIVRDQPKLLLVNPEGMDPDLLKGAFEREGAAVTIVDPADVPWRLSELGVYDTIVLNNVTAEALSIDQLTGLQEATRTLGRGLVVVGGAASYGPGGYAGTILEETLPVTVKVTDGRERQRVAILLIMDKSGSMSYDPLGGTSKIDMAKEAVRLAAESLADGDQVGILAFNDQQHWIVQMVTIEGQSSRDQINAAIDDIAADGGTEIYPALQVGLDAIRNIDADVRHIVLLSDGKSRTGTRESYQKLIDDVIADRTTLSTVAIGDDADTDLLQFLAEEGNGRYHFTEKAEDIPKVTLAETQSAGSQSVIRGPFNAIQTQPSPIMLDFDPAELPDLDGYDFAEAKPNAQVVLTSERDDPVLTKWQYGLGRVVAWTADDGSDFGASWPAWDRYDDFWASMIRWTLPDPENRPIQVSVASDGPEAVITADSIGEGGDYVDLATTKATITSPSGAVTENLPLYQSGPGEYQVRVAAPEPGAYKIELTQQRGDEPVQEIAGFAVPPSPELQPSADGHQFLETLATRTGGRVLSLEGPDGVFDGDGLTGSALRDYRPIWYYPLSAALALLLVELAVRLQFLPRLSRAALAFRR